MKNTVICGLPAATFLLCNVLRVSVTNGIILHVADLSAVAAFSIQNTLRPLAVGLTLGTGVTALLVCSVIVGEGNRHAIRKELAYILRVGFLIALAMMAVILLTAKYPLALLFCVGKPEAFTTLVARVLRLYALSIPFSMISSIFVYYYQSMRKLILSSVICILDNAVFIIAAAKILSGFMGLTGVWLSYISAETLTLITIFIYTWIKKRNFPKSLHDYLLLPVKFGVPAEDRMNITITSHEEAAGISAQIVDFCKDHGLSSKRSMAAELCIEELSVIAIDAGKNPSRTYVDVYVAWQNGILTVRLQDNSRMFDRKLLAGLPHPDDSCANIGVRLVKALTNELNYRVVLGMNVLSIKL